MLLECFHELYSSGSLNFKRKSGFLAPLAIGQCAYVMARHAFVHALTFSLNSFFSETIYRILMKFHRNVPTMVLFRIGERI